MSPFTYLKPAGVEAAVSAIGLSNDARFIAGGTNLLDLMKENLARPASLVDINRLPLDRIEQVDNGGLMLGALARNADTAYHPIVQQRYPLLAEAILAGASPQLRNAASNGGNLLQRTRCYYFYDAGVPCNKREPGTGCPAVTGLSRIHAIFGASEHCIAVHPSDMCVALAALDARVHVVSERGERTIEFSDFHRLPGDRPDLDTTLEADELITGIELPPNGFSAHSAYVKLRDRQSYAFALVSVAAALELAEDGRIVQARVALGGVAHKPWRDVVAEGALSGQPPSSAKFEEVAASILQGARPFAHNAYKIPLARRAVVRALELASGLPPSSPGDSDGSAYYPESAA